MKAIEPNAVWLRKYGDAMQGSVTEFPKMRGRLQDMSTDDLLAWTLAIVHEGRLIRKRWTYMHKHSGECKHSNPACLYATDSTLDRK